VVWVPMAQGTVARLDRQLANPTVINPFTDANIQRYVTGPLVVDADGTLLYNVIELDQTMPTSADAPGYLVRVPTSGSPPVAPYQSIVVGAPAATDQCPYTFAPGNPPYPLTTPVPTGPCGSQRPGWNAAPAIGPGGTIFVVSRAHYSGNDTSLVALNSDLSHRWTFPMRHLLTDASRALP